MSNHQTDTAPAGQMAGWSAYIDRVYASQPALKSILLKHSRAVAQLALSLNGRLDHPLPPELVETAAMLHDVGIIHTDAPSIECHGTEPYIRHGVIGAEMLRRDGCNEALARVAERHTGAGLSRDDIRSQCLPLPLDVDLMPRTQLERLVCYADKFYSKSGDMEQKDYDRVSRQMERHSADTLRRFEALAAEFGRP